MLQRQRLLLEQRTVATAAGSCNSRNYDVGLVDGAVAVAAAAAAAFEVVVGSRATAVWQHLATLLGPMNTETESWVSV